MNILFTTLSIRSQNPRTCFYITDNYKREDCKGKYNIWCSGIHQQEPGAKKFLAEEKIEKIVIFGSDATYHPESDEELFHTELSLWNGKLETMSKKEMDELSSLRFLIYRLADFVYGNSEKSDKAYLTDEVYFKYYEKLVQLKPFADLPDKIPVVFIPDKIKIITEDKNSNQTIIQSENLKALVNELKGNSTDSNYLFMDMQGGDRTKVYVNNALLQLLGNQEKVYFTELKRVVATQFDYRAVFDESKNRIVDETNRYRIVDLVSAMNAFFNHGKSKQLKLYLENLQKETNFIIDDNIQKLIDSIVEMDSAITYCRINESSEEENKNPGSGTVYLKTAVYKLRTAVNNITNDMNTNKTNYIGNYFDILIDGIKADLGELLNEGDIDIIALIDWCVKKENYVVATAIAEDSLPSFFVRHGILYYAQNAEELEKAKLYFKYRFITSESYSTFTFKDINHFFIKTYLGDLNAYPNCKYDLYPRLERANSLSTIINNTAEDNKNYPVNLYTDTKCSEIDPPILSLKEDTDKHQAEDVLQILVLYSFVSFNRNCLAHANNESKVEPETLKDALEQLIELSKKYRNTFISDEIYLPDDTICQQAGYEKDLKKIKELWEPEKKSIIKKEIEYELEYRNKPYGMMNIYITHLQYKIKYNGYQYPKKFGYKNVYALSPLLIPLIQLYNSFGRKMYLEFDMKEALIRDKEFVLFAKLLIDYYNKDKSDEELISYKNFTQKQFSADKKSDKSSKKEYTEITIDVKFLNDFFGSSPNNPTQADWIAYCDKQKAEYNIKIKKGGTKNEIEQNASKLNSLFDCIGCYRNPDWKKIICHFLENDFDTLLDALK